MVAVPTDAQQLRLPRSIWGMFALVSLALGAITAWLLGSSSQISYTGIPQLQLPLPPRAAVNDTARTRDGRELAAGDAATASALPALIEQGPYGALPRIAADGRLPFLAYAHPFADIGSRARISLLVFGLGLQAEPTAAALRLPAEVGLLFSAHAPDLPDWVARARAAGHEVLLELPLEPADYPASDPGPYTLLAGNPAQENLRRLDWLLARAQGYIAVAGAGGRFAASMAAPPVLDTLARRGLALVEVGDRNLAEEAAGVGLPYANAATVIDQDPSILSIDFALAGLEAEALASGSAFGVAQAYPVSLERLRLWATTLKDKGLVLAPVSAFVIERSGLATESGDRDPRARASRG
jgi:uncharacterized protein